MKKKYSVRYLLATLACLTTFLVVDAGPRDTQWKKVGDAANKGLPKTAIEHLQPIIDGAIKDKAYPEAIKAIGMKIAYEGNIQGNKPEEKILRMQAEIAKAPKEMVPVMDALLGHWYWHYFQQNRWRFVQRTATAEAPGNDIQTWDLPRLFAEIDKQFTKALSAEKELKATPIASYEQLISAGNISDKYRPTLYDFVVYDALTFYLSPEQAGSKAEDNFELLATSPVFAPAEEFRKWDVATSDKDSRLVKAIKLYQQLLQFHEKDEDRSAYHDADLERLNMAYNKSFGEEKAAVYKSALKQFAERHAKHELSSKALFFWANALYGEGAWAEAHQLAMRGEKAYPDSLGGKMCHNLIQTIEAKQSQVTVERVWNNPLPSIKLTYRNISKIYFRAYKLDYTERIKKNNYRPEHLSHLEQQLLLTKAADKEWAVDLPETADFKQKLHEIPAPADLKPGFYYLVTSHDPNFLKTNNNMVLFADFWVSTLAIISQTRWQDGIYQGLVLDALTGEPIVGASIQPWLRDNQGKFNPWAKLESDKNGKFSVSANNQGSFLFVVTHKDQQVSTANDFYLHQYNNNPTVHRQTVFFTDRSLYRPGQMIQFKGITIQFNQTVDNYTTVPNHTLNVIFADPNGKEIARQQVRSNEYGSFSGSFSAPRDRLLGRMSIYADGSAHGVTMINVEEYKRPKFQVTLEAPKTAPKLNTDVLLLGKAMAYTGSPIGGAKVRYRVVRQVRYPDWWYGFYWWRAPRTDSQEIAHGWTTTESDGSFPIQFVAKPDLSVPEKDEPTFSYGIYADVTDTNGETRSAERSVQVGYTALRAKLATQEWQVENKPVELNIVTETLDGEGQPAKGKLSIFKLKQPEKVQRADLAGRSYHYHQPVSTKEGAPKPDPAKPESWEQGDEVIVKDFATEENGKVTVPCTLPNGIYRAIVDTQDRFGKKVKAILVVTVLKPQATALGIKVPNHFTAPKWSVEPGQEFTALWGSGYDKARAFVEIEHRRKIIQSYWTDAGTTQHLIKLPVTEAMRGGFTVRVTMVRENRAYLSSHLVNVPWSNKDLQIKWEHFVSRLDPAKKETFTAVITGPDAKKAVAEMVATLYDESLDAYLPHRMTQKFQVFRQDSTHVASQFENRMQYFNHMHGKFPSSYKDVQVTYRHYPNELVANLWGYEFWGEGGGMGGMGGPGRGGYYRQNEQLKSSMGRDAGDERYSLTESAPKSEPRKDAANGLEKAKEAAGDPAAPPPGGEGERPNGGNVGDVSPRKNLNETAFFFPHLISGEDGTVKLEFTMPEALTKWKFMGFAHDRELRSGYIEDHVVTAKDLMVQPNSPRFLRERDMLEFTVKVTNQSLTKQTGTARLTFSEARTGKNVDALLGLTNIDQPFDVPAKEAKTLSWKIQVPDGMETLVYKAVGAAEKLSDGEEGYLPVLSRRVLVTESLPLPIRGMGQKTFDFNKLRRSGESNSLQHQSLTVQMVSNPSWYAVMALPYLMEYPYECSEQTFNRLYANAVARHIANSDPKIRRVFEQWKGTPALDSPLEKNQDLKSVMVEETPWLRQAQKESAARRNVGILFDENRLNTETANLLAKLAQMQMADGAWPWFPGGRGNDYITLYITNGFGRMRHLGVKVDMQPAIRSLARLDGWIDNTYQLILKHSDPSKNHLNPTIALYLYGRSFFLNDKAIDPAHKPAVEYFLGQARKYWLQLANRQSQAHLAVALKRFGDKATPTDIMKSIKERSVSNEEMGMFWRETELSHWWFHAPIETQAMMIEAFDEVMNDATAVEDCKVWLLKQKQTQDWKTTKATADAVYGLLLKGDNLLKSDALVEVALGDLKIQPAKVEAGTGFYEQRLLRTEVKPEFGQITVKKSDPGVAWGSVHWQYLEDMSKITAHDATPLKVNKTLYLREYTKKGPVLEKVNGPIKVGDEVVVRIEIRTDRDMEYVHLKDYRGSGTEPVNVLSRYRYQDGLGYYETTRDTASHFFIDYLPKGTYVFEYSTRIVHKGQYQTGMAEIQCMYAPEFNSHSQSIPLEVK